MTQIDVKDLDYSSAMRTFFETVQSILVQKHERTPEQARELVDRFFAMDINPLERALVMHDDAEIVAADLSQLTA